jgi:hypothetical protein
MEPNKIDTVYRERYPRRKMGFGCPKKDEMIREEQARSL